MKTSLYTILCIVIRLGAVIIGLKLLMELPGWWYAVHESKSALDIFVPLGLWALFLVFAAFLWLYPGALARAAAGRSSTQIFESPISAGQMLYVGFAILGAFFILKGLWAAIYQGLRLMLITQITGDQFASGPARTQCWIDIGSDLAIVVLGTAFVFGARGLAELTQRLRYGNKVWKEQQQ